jgi:hypothetical protein
MHRGNTVPDNAHPILAGSVAGAVKLSVMALFTCIGASVLRLSSQLLPDPSSSRPDRMTGGTFRSYQPHFSPDKASVASYYTL